MHSGHRGYKGKKIFWLNLHCCHVSSTLRCQKVTWKGLKFEKMPLASLVFTCRYRCFCQLASIYEVKMVNFAIRWNFCTRLHAIIMGGKMCPNMCSFMIKSTNPNKPKGKRGRTVFLKSIFNEKWPKLTFL